MKHRWHFFRAGGVDQVSLRDGNDLLALRDLDQKLWVALAMPVTGVDVDSETLALLDHDHDGRIRVQDILAAIDFIEKSFRSPDDVLTSRAAVPLSAIADASILAAAKRMLADLGKPDATEIHLDDTTAITKAFTATVLNGDGIIIPESANDEDVGHVITDVLANVGSVLDRSGNPGVDKARVDEFFAAVDQRTAWLAKGTAPAIRALGDATEVAASAYLDVRDKLDDYFTRCEVVAFDARSGGFLAGKDEDLASLAARSLSATDSELAKLPLAKPDPTGTLNLAHGINPAWSAKVKQFERVTVVPLLGGARDRLTAADVATIRDKIAGFLAWQGSNPTTKVDGLDVQWLARLAKPELRAVVLALIEKDGSLAAEYDQITSVTKLVRLQRDGARVLRNFVNFADFYSRQDGVFQAGTLYLDARAIHLCVPVTDAGKHAALAASSAAFLLYCEIKRKGSVREIAAAITNGDSDNLFVGRNGVFYDRDGNDWDATITKIIANPISVRQAFWSPYKKLVRTIEEAVTKRAAAADAAANAKVEGAGQKVAEADKAAAAPKKIDLGTVAAIGVAIGGVGTLFGALLASMFGLGKWLPLGIIGLLLMISGPAMLLAWLKLRRRNLGPILDANGWAINGRARINVAFGARMTELAALPKGSQRSLDDPYADKKTPWKRWVFLIVIIIVGVCWWKGKLDRYLPQRIRSSEVLGERAPATPAETPSAQTPGK